MSEATEVFRVALLGAGIPISGEIIADGALHRYKTEGDSQENCWYVLFADEPVNASYGCWKRQIKEQWYLRNGDPKVLTKEENAEMRRRWREAEVQRAAEEANRYERVSAAVTARAARLAKAQYSHDYLRSKAVTTYGNLLEDEDGKLFLPLQDVYGKVWSCQRIYADGTKRYAAGGRISGCFYWLADRTDGPLIICEGYSTGASIHQATGWAVACAMDAGNLLPVAKALREAYPERTLLIAADNDKWDKKTGELRKNIEGKTLNPGLDAATAVAKAVKGVLVVPEFPDTDRISTDFNDLSRVSGLEAVLPVFERALASANSNKADDLPGNEDFPNEPDPWVFTLPAIIDSADFMAQVIPRSPQIIQGLVHKGTKVIIGGSSKSFKTWNQLDINMSIAYGVPWLDFETVQGRVLFVNFEVQDEFFQDRLGWILKARGLKLERKRMDIWNLRGKAAPYALIIPQIIERIKNEGYSLVNLDPIYKLYGSANENDASEIAQLLNSLEQVCVETSAAVLFGAHYSKGNQSSKDSIDRVSGSGVFARDPDSIIPFTNHEEKGSFVVEPTLRNLPPVEPFVVTWNFPLMERNPTLDPARLKQAGGAPKLYSADTILALLKDGPLPLQKWQEIAFEKHQISRSTFFRLKSELKSHDLIIYSRINDSWVALDKK